MSANVLVMPAIHSAAIATKLLTSMSRATVIGPILAGLGKPVKLTTTTATVSDVLNMAVMAACRVG